MVLGNYVSVERKDGSKVLMCLDNNKLRLRSLKKRAVMIITALYILMNIFSIGIELLYPATLADKFDRIIASIYFSLGAGIIFSAISLFIIKHNINSEDNSVMYLSLEDVLNDIDIDRQVENRRVEVKRIKVLTLFMCFAWIILVSSKNMVGVLSIVYILLRHFIFTLFFILPFEDARYESNLLQFIVERQRASGTL